MNRFSTCLLLPFLAITSILQAQGTSPEVKNPGGKSAPAPSLEKKSPDTKAEKTQPPEKGKNRPPFGKKKGAGKGSSEVKGGMPFSKLKPALLVPNFCAVRYRVTTGSPEAQAFFDQGLGFFYSYMWMEAARSFETAAKHDPNCAMAWWGLSRAIEKWGKGQHAGALKKAQELLPRTSHRESLLIKARLAEKGMLEGVKPDDRKKEAQKYLDELLCLYDDDEEAWFAKAQLAGNPQAAIPLYKVLLRINPEHAGAHHELVHLYENTRRPALGWPHAEGYIRSSPGSWHAFHMQAHLAMRIGKWDKTTDRSAKAIELERAYHKLMGVKPNEDWQFSHHLETLMTSLTHDGRFAEARKLKKMCEGYKYSHWLPWFRLHVAERDWTEAMKVAEHFAKRKDKTMASYLRAVVYLRQGNHERAAPEVAVLEEAYRSRRNDKQLQLKLWETQGLLQCMQGGSEGGLKLLQKAVKGTIDDYRAHAWGHGAYFMETWGLGALQAGRLDVAEEAFLEALAHDAGSVRGALGMVVVCRKQGREEEALRFAEVAQRCWSRADPGALQAELEALRQIGTGTATSVPVPTNIEATGSGERSRR